MANIYTSLQTYGTPGKVNPLVLNPLRRLVVFVTTAVREILFVQPT